MIKRKTILWLKVTRTRLIKIRDRNVKIGFAVKFKVKHYYFS